MTHRVIHNLKWAKQLSSKPSCIPTGRPRGTKAIGIAYERKVAKTLRADGFDASPGVWFEFFDEAQGHGYCQVDVLLRHKAQLFILECKLSDVLGAREKLRDLYIPVVSTALGAPARGIVVARHVTREPDLNLVCENLERALKFSGPVDHHGQMNKRKYASPTVHWLGRGPL